MQSTPPATLLDEILEFVLSRPTLEQVIAYSVPETLDQRLHYLLDRNSHYELTLDEHSELDEFIRIGHLLRMLKAKARFKLARSSESRIFDLHIDNIFVRDDFDDELPDSFWLNKTDLL